MHENRECIWFFFFQAEDGIRDKLVTGVQTCALPISGSVLLKPHPDGLIERAASPITRIREKGFQRSTIGRASYWPLTQTSRSEERRVGKECRSRWSTYQ